MIYETLRDSLSNPSWDGPKVAADIREAAIRSLTSFIIALDLPRHDPRLTRYHVEFLYRQLSNEAIKSHSSTGHTLRDFKPVAAECLAILESAYPLMLSLDATALMSLAAKEVICPTPGHIHTQLAATVVSNLASAYLRQQEEYASFSSSLEDEINLLNENTTVVGSLEDDLSSDSDAEDQTEEVLAAAAEVLSLPETKGCVRNYEDEEVPSHMIGSTTPVVHEEAIITSVAEPDGAASTSKSSSPGASQRSPKKSENNVDVKCGISSPRGILVNSRSVESMASIPSKQSSRISMLSSVAELDEMEAAASRSATCDANNIVMRERPAPAAGSTGLPLSSHLQRTTSDAGSISWTAISTPRSLPAELHLLQRVGSGTGNQLRRFVVPLHIQLNDPGALPRLLVTGEARAALQDAAQMFLGAMRRMSSKGVAQITKLLPDILKAARPSSAQLWPVLERQLSTGSTPLLRAVLDLHDAVPELFQGRSPSLLEKVIVQVNNSTLSVDHRIAGASWVLRQHAQQRHMGAPDFLLADCWEQLLPRTKEPLQLATIKVKILAACLSSGIGDEEVICRSICAWEGYISKDKDKQLPATEQRDRAFTYALRVLYSSMVASIDSPAAEKYRMQACLISALMGTIVAHPQLVQAVDSFLETCPEEFSSMFLKALAAMLSNINGQFEVLQRSGEDLSLDYTRRMTSNVINRSSSLAAGLVRGLSVKLPFNSIRLQAPSSSMPLSARGPQRPREEEPPLPLSARTHYSVGINNVATLRDKISSAFHRKKTAPAVIARAGPLGEEIRPGAAQGPSIDRSVVASTLEDHFLSCEDGTTSPDEEERMFCPAVPMDFSSLGSFDAWSSSSATWEVLGRGMLTQDLLAYRVLLKRVLRNKAVHPKGTLRILAKYVKQYQGYHSSHALPAKEIGAAVLGLCHCAALIHLPCENEAWWTQRQVEVAESVQNVLDALEEGFPVPCVQIRAQGLSLLLAREAGWSGEALQSTLFSMVNGCIDAAVQGR